MDAEQEVSEARKELDEAERAHRELVDRYFPVRNVQPGQRIETGKPLTEDALEEVQRTEKRVEDAHKRLAMHMRIYLVERNRGQGKR